MKEKQILLIGDIVGYGKVALSAMIPILSYMGVRAQNLPTAIISNTLDHGIFEILDTTTYMQKTLEIWKRNGFSFDAIFTGFLLNEKQMDIISDLCKKMSLENKLIFNDPIMADWGELYNGVTDKNVAYMKEIVSISDITIPNYTEACFLTDTKINMESISKLEITKIIDKLLTSGAKNVIITSTFTENEKCIAGFDAKKNDYFFIPYNEIPVKATGTGDIFSSVTIGHIMKGESVENSARHAGRVVRSMIQKNSFNEGTMNGLTIEKFMNILDE